MCYGGALYVMAVYCVVGRCTVCYGGVIGSGWCHVCYGGVLYVRVVYYVQYTTIT